MHMSVVVIPCVHQRTTAECHSATVLLRLRQHALSSVRPGFRVAPGGAVLRLLQTSLEWWCPVFRTLPGTPCQRVDIDHWTTSRGQPKPNNKQSKPPTPQKETIRQCRRVSQAIWPCPHSTVHTYIRHFVDAVVVDTNTCRRYTQTEDGIRQSWSLSHGAE